LPALRAELRFTESAGQILENLEMNVEEFVGKYKLGGIKQAGGWKFQGMTVQQALESGGRELLTESTLCFRRHVSRRFI